MKLRLAQKASVQTVDGKDQQLVMRRLSGKQRRQKQQSKQESQQLRFYDLTCAGTRRPAPAAEEPDCQWESASVVKFVLEEKIKPSRR